MREGWTFTSVLPERVRVEISDLRVAVPWGWSSAFMEPLSDFRSVREPWTRDAVIEPLFVWMVER